MHDEVGVLGVDALALELDADLVGRTLLMPDPFTIAELRARRTTSGPAAGPSR